MTAVSRTQKRPGRPIDVPRRERMMAEILAVAAQQFAESGYSTTDLSVVAAAVGVSKPTLYYYFNSKEGLFLAALDAEVRRLREAVISAAENCHDPLDEMVSVIYSYLRFFDENPHVVELLIQERSHFREREKPTYFIHQEQTMPRWRELLTALMTAGRIRTVNLDDLLEVVSNSLYGTVFTNHFCRRSRRYEEQAGAIVDLLVSGLIVKEAEPKSRTRAAIG